MTPAQTAKYFAEFGHLRDVLLARGWSPTRIEQHRHALTRKSLGVDKSSKEFTNAELDKVLAVIAAERAPADFNAQMRLQDQPERRVALLVQRISGLARAMGFEDHYVDGISRRMFGSQYHHCPERALQQIEGILRRKLRNSPRTAEEIHAIERDVAEGAAKLAEISARAAAPHPVAVHSEEEPLF